jgi:hypothetical protein
MLIGIAIGAVSMSVVLLGVKGAMAYWKARAKKVEDKAKTLINSLKE